MTCDWMFLRIIHVINHVITWELLIWLFPDTQQRTFVTPQVAPRSILECNSSKVWCTERENKRKREGDSRGREEQKKKTKQERKSRWEAARPGKGRRGVRVWVEEEEEAEEAKRHRGGGGGGGGGGWIQADPCVYVCCCVSQWVSSALAPAGNASTKQRQYTHHPLFTPIQSPLMRVTLYMPSAPHRSYRAAV